MPDEPSTPEICDRPSEKYEQLSATPGNLTLSRPFKGLLLPFLDDLRSRIPPKKGLREGGRESVARIGRLACGDGWRRRMTPSVTLDSPCRSRPMRPPLTVSRHSGAGAGSIQWIQ